ncbi:hypothetical protein PCASD_12490, partial [Puccinia coronata f. sp. avenae]
MTHPESEKKAQSSTPSDSHPKDKRQTVHHTGQDTLPMVFDSSKVYFILSQAEDSGSVDTPLLNQANKTREASSASSKPTEQD